jgi:hypothetical protein
MLYEDARNLIQTGDLIGVRHAEGLIGGMTALVTADPHTHTGIAVWLGGRLFMADLNSGRNHLTPLSQLGAFDVCEPPEGLDRAMIEAAVFDCLAKPINYGFAAFVVIGLKCALRLKVFIHWRRIIVCSGGSVEIFEMAAALMRDAGQVAPAAWLEHSRMVSPGELVSELQLKLRVGYGEDVPQVQQLSTIGR